MHSFLSVAKLITSISSPAKKTVPESPKEPTRTEDDGDGFNMDSTAPARRIIKNTGNLNKLHPVLFWDPPALTYPEPLTEEHFVAHCKDFKARSVQGEFFFDPQAGLVFPAGNHELTATFVPAKSHKYLSITETRTIVVKKRKPLVTWDFPYKEILLGTVLGEEHFAGVRCELTGGKFYFSHEPDRMLPIGTHKMSVEYEPSAEERCNYTRGYASVTFDIVGTTVPIVWKIPFSAESYEFFTKHVQDMAEASTFVVETPPPVVKQREDVDMGSRGGQRNRKKQQEAERAAAEKAAQEAAEKKANMKEYTPESAVVVTQLPSRRRSSAFTAGAPIIYPDPLPEWLYQAEAVFFNAETQESEYVPGRMEYDPPAGTALPAGVYTIHLTFYPEDLSRYRVTKASRKVSVLKSPVPLEWPLSVGMTDGALLDKHSLNCTNTLGLLGRFTYTPNFGETLPEGRHMLSVRFDPEDSANYHSATTSVPFQVRHKKVPVIYWAPPPDIVHPFPLSRLQLNAACRGGGFYRGQFVYEPSFDAVLDAGVHQLKVTFIPELATVQVVTATVELVVQKGLSRLLWNNPEPLFDGQRLFDDVLTCKCTNLTGGTFIYDPPKGTILNAGPHKISVRYIPDNPNYMENEMYIKMQVKPKPVRAQSKYYVS